MEESTRSAVPLKVTFLLNSPVVVDSEYPTHLDGLLAWCRVNEAEEYDDPNPLLAQEDLPLDRAGQGPDWVWKASRLVFTPATPRQLVNMQRKTDPEAIYNAFDQGLWGFPNLKDSKRSEGKTPPTVNTQSGQMRAYQFYVATQWMEKVEAWCVGDPLRVRELLDRLETLGKLGRIGYGQIRSITVVEDPEASEKWRLRILPDDVPGLGGTEYVPISSPPRAPYWDKRAQRLMKEPVV